MKRKFIIICVVIFVFVFVIASLLYWRGKLAMAVDAKLQEIRAAGLPTDGKELNAYYPAVPDNKNAALVMTQAFALVGDYSDSRSNEIANFKIPSRGQSLTPEQKKLLSGYAEMNSDAFAKMREAIKLPESRYPLDYTPGPDTLLPHLGKLKKLAVIVRYKSFLESESGDTTNAVFDIENLCGMSQTLDQEPDMIAQLVRIALIAIAENSLEHSFNLSSLNESELAGLASAFSQAEKTNLMRKALIGELALNAPVFQLVRSRPKSAVELVEGAQQVGGFSTHTLDFWLIREPGFFRATGFWDRDFLFYLNTLETNIALDNFPPPKSLVAADNFKKVDETVGRKNYYLSKMFLGALSSAITKEASSFACLRTSIAAIAVERFRLAHGRLPENLNELVPQFLSAMPLDPFDGQPLRYHRLAKGYVIYSVGQDGHDDGGREKPADWKSSDKTTYDITFTVER
jgi:Bacterial type II secretion system protein G.